MCADKKASYAEGIWQGQLKPAVRSSPGHPLSINEMKDAMVRLYDESNRQNFAVFDEMFAPDFVSYGGAGFQDLNGAEAFRQLYIQFTGSMPNLTFRVDNLIAEGNLCGVYGTLSGTHKGNFMGFAPPTGKRITWTGTAIFRFNNQGLMDARWQEWDGLSVMQQMGVVPTPPGSNGKLPDPVPPHVTGGRYTSPAENKAIFQRFIEEVWNQGKLEVADEIFHPQATSPSAPQLPTGGEGVKVIASMFRNAMPDYHIEIIDLLADGNQVLARFKQSGTQTGELMGIPPTGKKVSWGEIGILRFAGGQVVESWYNVDLLGLMQQLGVGGSSAGA
ncbi:MAG: ester cyclase family protein [Chloroflexota bacterium]